MFGYLNIHSKILVTGPQRSGTRILTKMISYDLGYGYIDEVVIGMLSFQQIAIFLKSCERVVVQCPVLCRYIHSFSDDSIAMVMSYRKIFDIIKSQERISWGGEKEELEKYGLNSGIISEVKYYCWEKYQKDKIRHSYDIKYEELSNHPLWVESDQRMNFRWNQTEV
jgi:hypothetical protein